MYYIFSFLILAGQLYYQPSDRFESFMEEGCKALDEVPPNFKSAFISFELAEKFARDELRDSAKQELARKAQDFVGDKQIEQYKIFTDSLQIKGKVSESNRLALTSDKVRIEKQTEALYLAFLAKNFVHNIGRDPSPEIENTFGQTAQKRLAHVISKGYNDISEVYPLNNSSNVLLIDQRLKVKLLNTEREETTLLRSLKNEMYSFSVSPNDEKMLIGFKDDPLRLLSLKENEKIETVFDTIDQQVVFSIFSNNNKWMLTGSRNNIAKLWDKNGRLIKILDDHQGNVYGETFSPNDQYFVTRGTDLTLFVWNVKGEKVSTLTGHKSLINKVQFFPKDDNQILSISEDGQVIVWETLSGSIIKKFDQNGIGVIDASILNGGAQIVIQRRDGQLRLLDINSNKVIEFPHNEQVTAFTINKEENRIITGTKRGYLFKWKMNGTLDFEFKDHHQRQVEDIRWSQKNSLILTTARDSTSKLWDNRGNLIFTIKSNNPYFLPAFFSKDEQHIFSVNKESLSICPIPSVAFEYLKKSDFFSNTYKEEMNQKYSIEQFASPIEFNPLGDPNFDPCK